MGGRPLRLNLIPRERKFFDLFNQEIANIVNATNLLVELLHNPNDGGQRQHTIKSLEHDGDELTHQIVRDLNRVFVTPFDREDIYALTSLLDDVLDYVEEVSETISLYDVREVPHPMLEMGGILLRAAKELQEGIGKLESQKDLEKHWTEVNRLENLGDQVERTAVGELFRNGTEPIEMMKLKDLYMLLEAGLDTCEDVANVLENIVIKNA
jgi:predicted phosphate transport protein (TIGR00153 family)